MRKYRIIEHLYSLIKEYLSDDYTYHGIHHTQDVHRITLFYIDFYGISGKEAELLEIAAVAHDIGFIESRKNHEMAGAKIVNALMQDYGYTEDDCQLVRNLILATSFPQKPKSFLEEILCDADLDYIGRDDFESISKTLMEEWNHFDRIPVSNEDFDRMQIQFFNEHQFHTEYAKKVRKPIKIKHLEALRMRQLYASSSFHFGKIKTRATA